MGVGERVPGDDDVAASKLERVDTQPLGQLIHRRLDGEDHLPETVAAEGARWNVVGVHRLSVDALVRTAVHRDRLAAPVEHHAGAVVAVRPRIHHDVDGQCGQHAIGPGGDGGIDARGVAAWGADELIGAAVLVAHRLAQSQDRQRDEVLGQHLLLAAEATADPAREHVDVRSIEAEDVAELVAHQEGHL